MQLGAAGGGGGTQPGRPARLGVPFGAVRLTDSSTSYLVSLGAMIQNIYDIHMRITEISEKLNVRELQRDLQDEPPGDADVGHLHDARRTPPSCPCCGGGHGGSIPAQYVVHENAGSTDGQRNS